MTLEDFHREARRLEREKFTGSGRSFFDLLIERTRFEEAQLRKLLAMASKITNRRGLTQCQLLQRKLVRLAVSRARFEKLREQQMPLPVMDLRNTVPVGRSSCRRIVIE